MRKSLILAACVSSVAIASPGWAVVNLGRLKAALSSMSQINAIAFTDLNSGHDIEGKAWAGRDATGNFIVGKGGASGSQANSVAKTLTVGRNLTGNVNVNDGTVGGTKVSNTGSFGVSYGIRVDGNVTGGVAFNGTSTATVVKVRGNVANNFNVADGSVVMVGGNVGTINAGNGTTVKIGGTATSLSSGNSSTISVVKTANSVQVGSGSTVTAGADVNSLNMGANSTARISGNAGSGNFNLSSGDQVFIKGQLQTQNLNGGSFTVETNGARFGSTQNPAPSNYKFNQNNSFATVAAPTFASTNVAAQTDTMKTNFTYLSAALAGLTPISALTTTSPITNYGNASYAVFSASQTLFGLSGDLQDLFATMGNRTVIINVAGTNITQDANFNAIAGYQNVIWNFYEAQSVSLKGFYGSVLAPLATFTNSSAVNGSVVANLINANGEIHLGTFAGSTRFLETITTDGPSSPTPEPGTWAMMLIGFGAIGVAARRRSRQQRLAA